MPVRLIGIPDGVRNFGGVLDHSLRELEIEVLPADIPEHIDLDVTALAIGHSLFVRDIKPEKFTVLNDPDTPICTVVAPRAEEAPAARRKRPRSPSRSSSASRRPRAKTRARPRRRPEPCSPSSGWAIPARSTSKPGTTPGFYWPTIWPADGTWAASAGRRARVAEGRWNGRPVRLLQPTTYMNRSGSALAPLLALPDFDPARDLLILVDDVAFPWAGSGFAARARPAGTTASRAWRPPAPGLRPAPHRRGACPRRTGRPRRLRAGPFPLDERRTLDETSIPWPTPSSRGRSTASSGPWPPTTAADQSVTEIMLRLGIVGLPNVGKSTLFNALTSAKALVANYPFATIEPNTGIVQVPDPRLRCSPGWWIRSGPFPLRWSSWTSPDW